MLFENPNILHALWALLIPIVVHLFKLRNFEKTPFTNVKFLIQLVEETRKSSQIKKWLVLCTRLLCFTVLILAFAQPYTPNNLPKNTKRKTIVYIDNSISMQGKGEKGELMKSAIQDLIRDFPSKESLHLLTNSDVFTNTSVEKNYNDFLGIKYTAHQLPLSDVALKAESLVQNNDDSLIDLILVSDFQNQTTIDTTLFKRFHTTQWVQVLPEHKQNISLDTAFIEGEELKLIIRNSHLSEVNSPVSLHKNNQLVSKISPVINQEYNTVTFPINRQESANYIARVQTNDLNFDNSLYLSRTIAEKINVLSIGSSINNSFLTKIFTSDEFNFIQQTPQKIDYSVFAAQHVLVINEIENISTALEQNIKAFERNGGTVIIIPINEDYNKLTGSIGKEKNYETRITTLNESHSILSDVFDKKVTNFQYPKIKKHFVLNKYSSEIIGLENQLPFLVKKNDFYIFSAPLNSNNSNFKQSPVIVPVFYNMAKHSLKENKLSYTLAKEQTIDIPIQIQKDEVISLSHENTNYSYIPLQQITPHKISFTTDSYPDTQGFYKVIHRKDALGTLAYNYPKTESNTEYLNFDKNLTVFKNLSSALSHVNSQYEVKSLWKWFVIFAFVFLIIELLILKYYR